MGARVYLLDWWTLIAPNLHLLYLYLSKPVSDILDTLGFYIEDITVIDIMFPPLLNYLTWCVCPYLISARQRTTRLQPYRGVVADRLVFWACSLNLNSFFYCSIYLDYWIINLILCKWGRSNVTLMYWLSLLRAEAAYAGPKELAGGRASSSGGGVKPTC